MSTLQNQAHKPGNRRAVFKLWLMMIAVLVLLAGCGTGGDEAGADEPAGNATENPADEAAMEPVVIDLGVEDDEVIAVYEGGKVTGGEFETYLQVQAFLYPQYAPMIQASDKQTMEEFLKRFIAEKTLASKSDMNTDEAGKQADEMVQEFLDQYAAYIGEDQVQETMEKQELDEQDLKEYVLRNTLIESYLKTQVTPEKQEEVYQEKKDNGDYTIASVRHILISTESRTEEEAKQLAGDIADKLRNGEDFEALAKEYSDDPGSKDNGGLYEETPVSQWVEEFKQAAVELEIGKISDPIQTSYGYHVMKVEERKELTFEEVLEQSGEELDVEVMNREYERFVAEELEPLIEELNVPEIKKA
ncbi:MAG: peptidylprolyl isomerase [Bacillaceae bacterium]|nr:peptidylprolyl isomerase [Bacillaceae bacterium]